MEKVENLEKTDDEVLKEARDYNEEHKNDPDAARKTRKDEKGQSIEKDGRSIYVSKSVG